MGFMDKIKGKLTKRDRRLPPPGYRRDRYGDPYGPRQPYPERPIRREPFRGDFLGDKTNRSASGFDRRIPEFERREPPSRARWMTSGYDRENETKETEPERPERLEPGSRFHYETRAFPSVEEPPSIPNIAKRTHRPVEPMQLERSSSNVEEKLDFIKSQNKEIIEALTQILRELRMRRV